MFKCQTCHAVFNGHEEHVAHHKSDFHRFNLKRKMINLPPVTIEQFNTKVAEVKKEEEKEGTKEVVECKICKKKFASENTYKTHVNSSKHKDRVAAITQAQQEKLDENGEAMEVEAVNEKKETKIIRPKEQEAQQEDNRTMEEIIDEKIKNARKILLEECMFCLQKFPDLETNLEHMQKYHGFFIPDREHLKDVPGFIEYLGEKLSVGNVCLWCNEKSPSFYSLGAVQQHMDTLGHCKLAYEPDDQGEYSDFYDFSSETNNENSLIESPISDASSEFQLIFKDGVTIGHRSLARYYRQSYKPSDSRAVVLANTANAAQFKIANWYRDAIQMDKLRQAHESGVRRVTTDMTMGVRANFLWRWRKDNVTTRNSGR